MPLYEFKCRACSNQFEEVQGVKDPPLLFCPKCKGEVNRKFFDWDEKLKEYREYNAIIDRAPVFPYFFTLYFALLILFAVLGAIVFKGVYGFFATILWVLGVSIISLIGAVPVLGPFLYGFWLGPWFESFFQYHIVLPPSYFISFIYWLGFSFSVVITLFTTLYIIYRLNTPLLWCVMPLPAQEKFHYLLLSRLLNYEVTPLWFPPEGWLTNVVCALIGINDSPAVKLSGRVYYSKDIPVGPIKAIEERRRKLLRKSAIQ